MSVIADRIKKHARHYTQLIAAILYNSNAAGFFSGQIHRGVSKSLCSPGLNCYSCPGAVLSCPLGSLQNSLTTSPGAPLLYVLGTVMLFGILLGRLICGFLCPFGMLQGLLYRLPLPKLAKNPVTAVLSYLKYVILAVFVIAIPLIKLYPGFCKYICPAGTLEAGLPLTALDERLASLAGSLFSWKVFILCVILLICAVCYRAFCRFICPLGALYSLFNPVAFFGVTVDKGKCTGCNKCVKACRLDVKKVGDRECIHCGRCRAVCTANAVNYRCRAINRE